MDKTCQEVEYKFEVEDMIEAHRLGRASVWSDWPKVGEGSKFHCHSDYFDTEDEHLFELGIVLRLRREGEQTVLTVKRKPKQISRSCRFVRDEWAVVLDALTNHPTIEPLFKEHKDLAEILGKSVCSVIEQAQTLQYTVDFARQVRRIQVGQSIIEVALDQGFFKADYFEQPFIELELELIRGELADLDKLKDWVLKNMRVELKTISKYEQCRRLRFGNTSSES